MDNLTHTLTALAISQAGLSRKTRFATAALIAGANLPDIDVAAWAKGTATYLHYHRGITHSILGVVTLGILTGIAAYAFAKRAGPNKKGIAPNATWLVVCGLVGTGSHLLLDFTNAYGVRPFLPFSGRWYAWDIMFIIDPVVIFLLAAGLGVPMLLRLISEEVGAGKPAYRAGAILALASFAVILGLRDTFHRRALTLLDSVQFKQQNPKRIGAFPSPVNPLSWIGVAETDSEIFVVGISALDQRIATENAKPFPKPESSPPLEAAMRTSTGITFLDFARFPWGEVQTFDKAYRVTLRDLRFAMPGSNRPGFVVRVNLDRNLRVESESFSFRAPRRASLTHEQFEQPED